MISKFNETVTNRIRILPPSDGLKHHKFLELFRKQKNTKMIRAFHFFHIKLLFPLVLENNRKLILTSVKFWT